MESDDFSRLTFELDRTTFTTCLLTFLLLELFRQPDFPGMTPLQISKNLTSSIVDV